MAVEQMKTWLISDTHFDHVNIIRYCNRPFRDVAAMNAAMLLNWNNTVAPNDLVYFLGDMSLGKGFHSPLYWLNHLNGNKVCIKGAHDRGIKAKPFEYITIRGERVLLIHNPDDIPLDWHGWVIHGHKHNNDTVNYPFFNRERKTINVSVEVIDYRPVSLETIALILGTGGA